MSGEAPRSRGRNVPTQSVGTRVPDTGNRREIDYMRVLVVVQSRARARLGSRAAGRRGGAVALRRVRRRDEPAAARDDVTMAFSTLRPQRLT